MQYSYILHTYFSGEEVNHKFPINILEADYDNFAFTYDCRYDEMTKTRHGKFQ